MKKKYLIFIPIGILITIILLLSTRHIYLIDNVYNYIVIHIPWLTTILKGITNFGDFPYIFIICVILLIFYKKKKELINLYTVILISTLINNVIKIIVKRPRPELVHLVSEDSYSFPSGHAMASMTFYGYIIYMVWQSNLQKKWKVTITTLLSILILVIGYSRIYLNVHYVSDVLAGFMFSIILLYTFIKLQKANFAITRK